MILPLLMYALMASTFTINKLLVDWYTTPTFYVGARFLTAGLIFLLCSVLRTRTMPRIAGADWPLVLTHALVAMYASFMLEMWALQHVSAAKTCLLFNLAPFITATIAYFWVSHTLTLTQIGALAVGFCGFAPILMATAPEELSAHNIGFLSIYEIALFLSVAAYCYGWLVVHQLVAVRGYATTTVMGVSMTLAGMLALVTSWCVDSMPPVSEWAPFLFWIGFIVLVGNVIVFNLYGYLLKSHSPTFMNVAGFSAPLFAALYDWLFFGRVVPTAFFATLAIVFGALVAFYREEKRSNYL